MAVRARTAGAGSMRPAMRRACTARTGDVRTCTAAAACWRRRRVQCVRACDGARAPTSRDGAIALDDVRLPPASVVANRVRRATRTGRGTCPRCGVASSAADVHNRCVMDSLRVPTEGARLRCLPSQSVMRCLAALATQQVANAQPCAHSGDEGTPARCFVDCVFPCPPVCPPPPHSGSSRPPGTCQTHHCHHTTASSLGGPNFS